MQTSDIQFILDVVVIVLIVALGFAYFRKK